MKAKTLIFMFLAIACGLLATVGVRSYMQTQRAAQAAQPAEQMTKIMLARCDIPLAVEVTQKMLRESEWPKHLVPRGAVVEADQIVGRATRCPIFTGEPLVENKLADVGSERGLEAVIPKGMRAIAVKVNEFSGVAGFVQPGAHVDVVVVVPRRSETPATVSKMIIQDVLVLAVDQKLRRGEKDSQIVDAVTLLVTPDQAERLSLAANHGKVHLVMRNTTDKQVAETRGITLAKLVNSKTGPDLFGAGVQQLLTRIDQDRRQVKRPEPALFAAEARPKPGQAPRAYVVEEIRGTQLTVKELKCSARR